MRKVFIITILSFLSFYSKAELVQIEVKATSSIIEKINKWSKKDLPLIKINDFPVGCIRGIYKNSIELYLLKPILKEVNSNTEFYIYKGDLHLKSFRKGIPIRSGKQLEGQFHFIDHQPPFLKYPIPKNENQAELILGMSREAGLNQFKNCTYDEIEHYFDEQITVVYTPTLGDNEIETQIMQKNSSAFRKVFKNIDQDDIKRNDAQPIIAVNSTSVYFSYFMMLHNTNYLAAFHFRRNSEQKLVIWKIEILMG